MFAVIVVIWRYWWGCKFANGDGTISRVLGDDPESTVHGANMGPTWVLSAPMGPMLAPFIYMILGLGVGRYFADAFLLMEEALSFNPSGVKAGVFREN